MGRESRIANGTVTLKSNKGIEVVLGLQRIHVPTLGATVLFIAVAFLVYHFIFHMRKGG